MAGLLLALAVYCRPVPSLIPERSYVASVAPEELEVERYVDGEVRRRFGEGAAPADPPAPTGLWELRALRAQEAWTFLEERWRGEEERPRVKVGVYDGVLATSHPDLEGNIAPEEKEDWRAMTLGRVFSLGHGTGVMGLIAGSGSPGLTGVAPYVLLVPFSTLVLGKDTSAVAALRHFIQSGVRVANFAIALPYPMAEQSAIDEAYARGTLVVTGLYNRNTDAPAYPAAYERVLVVSGSDVNDQAAGFGWGPLVDLIAPAGSVLTTAPTLRVGPIALGPLYLPLCCNSAATAFATGVAALVLESDPTLTSAQVEKRLKLSARKTPEMVNENGRPVAWHPRYGYGVADAYSAVTFDRRGPEISLEALELRADGRARVTGTAMDDVQDSALDPLRQRDNHLRGVPTSNVARVEYRVDDGPWLAIASRDTVFSSGYSVRFEATVPVPPGEGLRQIQVRARDTAGNVGLPAARVFPVAGGD